MSRSIKSLSAAALVALASPVGAAVIIDSQPFQNPDPQAQIHSDGTQSGDGTVTGTTVGGATGQDGVSYVFSSSSNLTTNGSGHAKVAGPFQSLTLTRADGGLFSSIDFNLNVSGISANNPFFADVMVTLADNTTRLFDNLQLGNGQNKYLIFGNAGELFRSITFSGYRDAANTIAANFDDIRQIDINSAAVTAVPEPATWAMMILGMGLVGGTLRRRRRATLAAA